MRCRRNYSFARTALKVLQVVEAVRFTAKLKPFFFHALLR
jgi:hypothetical protein